MFLTQAAWAARPGGEGIELKAVIGYNGNGRGNMVWSPDQGYYNMMSGKVKQKTSRNIIPEDLGYIHTNTRISSMQENASISVHTSVLSPFQK